MSIRPHLRLTAALSIAAMFPAHAAAATIAGTAPGAVAAWVSGGPPAAPISAVMTNAGKRFVPPLVVVPAGSTVRFPNQDPFYHSIFSSEGPDPFDIGFYDTGPGKVVPFPHPGVVRVRCHIHAFMHALIIVTDGPSVLVSNGNYTFAGLKRGVHTVHVVFADGTVRDVEAVAR